MISTLSNLSDSCSCNSLQPSAIHASTTTTTTSARAPLTTKLLRHHQHSPSLSLCLFLVFLLFPFPAAFSSPLFSPSLSLSSSSPIPTTEPSSAELTWTIDELERAVGDADEPAAGVGENAYHAKPKWINPCGINSQTQNFGGHYDVTPLTDGELLENVVLAAKNALKHSRFFKEDYVSNRLSLDIM